MTAHPSRNELTGTRLLQGAVAQHGAATAYVDLDAGGRAISLADHFALSRAVVAAHRERLGLAPGDRYSVLARNSPSVVNLWHAALLGGGVFNPLNSRLAPAEWDYILNHSEASAIYLDGAHARPIAELKAAGRLPALRHLIPLDAMAGELLGEEPFDQACAGLDAELPETDESDPCMLVYTGGTTGLPKGVVLSQRALVANFYRNAMAGVFVEPMKLFSPMPMFHIGAGLAAIWCIGGGTLYTSGGFDPATFIATVEAEAIEAAALAPSMIGMILNHADYRPERLRSLRFIAYGSAPMPGATLERLLAELPAARLHQYYGMTESSSILTTMSPQAHLRPELRASAGRALPGIELSIRDAEGRAVAPGEVGEICARSSSIMTGYWKNPEASAAALRDGWYHSGDAGRLDGEGYLFIVDRLKDMIVSGGENIYSAEVEHALSTHPAVAQVAVIGIPHETWGEAVHAVVFCKADAERPAPEDLIAHCKRSIAGFKAPKTVEYSDDPLPMSGIMKIQKNALRDRHWSGRERRVG
jgi:long-chain acyl-CoA synthetase